jgi:hypothetical protein
MCSDAILLVGYVLYAACTCQFCQAKLRQRECNAFIESEKEERFVAKFMMQTL